MASIGNSKGHERVQRFDGPYKSFIRGFYRGTQPTGGREWSRRLLTRALSLGLMIRAIQASGLLRPSDLSSAQSYLFEQEQAVTAERSRRCKFSSAVKPCQESRNHAFWCLGFALRICVLTARITMCNIRLT